ncbi:Maf-like protein [Clostridium sp.]|uniref:Maf-like protein n=1 Tax=Clostridium sp. TaxID=1506 RepID=UPI002FC96513
MKYILASASARRQELLKRIVKDFDIIVSDFDENIIKFKGSIDKYVEDIALGKAKAILSDAGNDSIIISADTVVSYKGEILGKPKDKEDAFRMLTMLSGNTHEVYSGVCIINTKTNEILTDSFKTVVAFSEISDEDKLNYIESGSPLDKAGSYGIQDEGGVFVEGINGCYYNVVGLPLNKVKEMLKKITK